MKSKQKFASIFALTAITSIFVIAGLAEIPSSNAATTVTYEVTITNLTPGQPFTPPVLVTHNKDVSIFTLGEKASKEIQALSENGNPEPLVKMISANPGVTSVVQGTAPLVPANDPGKTGLSSSETFTITTEGSARYLSFASMLVCTNDGFAGIDGIRLPLTTRTVYATSFDAMTEVNTEDFADMVPPCQDAIGISSADSGTGTSDPSLAENGVIIPHPGVFGGADLIPKVHAWNDPVAKIEIHRMN